MNINTPELRKDFLTHASIIAFFFVIIMILFYPGVISGEVLNQHDISQWRATAEEVLDYRETTGEEALWTNSIFGGMPAYLISTRYNWDVTGFLTKVMSMGIPRPFSLVFLGFVCMYILLLTYRVKPLVAALGAVFFGCTSFIIIGLSAGHNAKVAAIAVMPLVVAGIKLVMDGKLKWGFLLTAIGLALEIRVNHLQITYYLALIVWVLGKNHLVLAIREKDLSFLTHKVPVLLFAAILGVAANTGQLWTLLEYSEYSTRGKNEYVTAGESPKSGLDKDYAFEFSNALLEPMVMFIPNWYGGSSFQELNEDSALGTAMRKNGVPRAQIQNSVSSVTTYWGPQRLSAPYYLGSIAIFLVVLALLTLKLRDKLWLVIIIVLGIMLSWGDTFQSFNYFMFDYFPGYNKFRAPTFAIIISMFGLVILGALGLNEVLTNMTPANKKKLLYAAAGTGGFAILAAILAGIGSYRGVIDEQLAQQVPEWYIDALRADRASLLRMDALRSAFFIFAAAGILWAITKEKVSMTVGMVAIVGLTALDCIMIDKRYLNEDNFERVRNAGLRSASAADNFILNDKTPGYRVLNLLNPFNEGHTSQFHSSVGGYHGAKMGRYQELIEQQIAPEMNELIQGLQSGNRNFNDLGVLNMLNTKYFKYSDEANGVLPNNAANGPAWFVTEIDAASTPNEVMDQLGEINTKTTAVVNTFDFSLQKTQLSGGGQIRVQEHTPKKITYQSTANSDAFAVFSEIYYPKGWEATIDGEKVDILRCNYVLRALQIPAGEHEIVFEFKPRAYLLGSKVNMAVAFAFIGIFLVFLFMDYRAMNTVSEE